MNTRLQRMLSDVQTEPTAARVTGRDAESVGRRATYTPDNKSLQEVDEEVLRTVEAELIGDVDEDVLRTVEAEMMGDWRAAEPDDAGARYHPGLVSAEDSDVPGNDSEAVSWYRRAAEQGDDNAQMILGYMYANGQSVPRDYVLAHMWFDLSAAHGRANALPNRDMAASRMTPEQIDEARRLARQWRPKPRR